jgi:serine/threonine protein phosphatase PrpC
MPEYPQCPPDENPRTGQVPGIAVLELKGSRQDQQDSHGFAEFENEGDTRLVLVVADGHGTGGDRAAELAVSRSLKATRTASVNANELREIFRSIHEEICAQFPHAGSTLTIAVRQGDELNIAHAGDCEVWVLKSEELRCLAIPHRHKEHPAETKRLDRMNAPVENGYISISNVGFIQVSRSLGDSQFEPFLLHEPELQTLSLSGKERFLLLGSDGFWNAAVGTQKKRRDLEHALCASGNSAEVKENMLKSLSREILPDNTTLLVYEFD